MTRANPIGVAVVYEAKNGNQMLVRFTDLFTDYKRTLELWLEQNGGLSHTIEPSLARTPYGVVERNHGPA